MPRTLTLALVQFTPRKGDYAANLARLEGILAQVAALEPAVEVVHLPETALSGYFLEGGVRDNAVTAGTLARDLDEAWRRVAAGRTIDIVAGFYETFRNTLYNAALYATLGDGDAALVRHVHRKGFLPTYGLFDEERFVERGLEFRAFDTAHGRMGMLVCEDAWHSLAGTIVALDGAEIVFVSSAAPARGIWPRDDGVPGPASVARWDRLVRDIAEEHGVFVSLVNLAGSEGGKFFSGSSTVAGPAGDVRVRAPLWREAIATITLDLDDLTRARADMPLLSDLRVALPHLRDNIERVIAGAPVATRFDAAADRAGAQPNAAGGAPRSQDGDGASAARHRSAAATSDASLPVIHVPTREHGLPPTLAIDGALTEEWLVHFIREEMTRRRLTTAVIGVSGGVDSAVTAYLAAKALGPERVLGVRLPYRTSSGESLEHGQLVIEALGIPHRTIDISAAVDGYLANEPDADAARRGNVMARMRMIALFDLSARHKGIPLGTGNKTERLFGYFTWHADDSPPVNPLGDLFKSQVWALARHLGVPSAIVSKPPSADLIVGQTDEGDFGIGYARADEILNWMLSGYSAADLVARGWDAKEVEIVRRRLEGTHWKRKLPTVAMLSPTAIGESYLRPVDY